MKRLWLLIMLLSFTLMACSTEEAPPDPESDDVTELVTQEGLIGMVDKEMKRILVLPDVAPSELEGKSEAEIGALAKDHSGAWYHADPTSYSKGQRVRVTYDKSGLQLDSNPPIRSAEDIEIMD